MYIYYYKRKKFAILPPQNPELYQNINLLPFDSERFTPTKINVSFIKLFTILLLIKNNFQ